MGQGPGAHRPADRQPALEVGLRRVVGGLGRGAQVVVAVDDEPGQQVVAAREVAVDGGGGHPQFPGNGAQRQGGRADLGQLASGRFGDLGGELGTDAFAGGGHALRMPEKDH
jgi:hypothetical protein